MNESEETRLKDTQNTLSTTPSSDHTTEQVSLFWLLHFVPLPDVMWNSLQYMPLSGTFSSTNRLQLSQIRVVKVLCPWTSVRHLHFVLAGSAPDLHLQYWVKPRDHRK